MGTGLQKASVNRPISKTLSESGGFGLMEEVIASL